MFQPGGEIMPTNTSPKVINFDEARLVEAVQQAVKTLTVIAEQRCDDDNETEERRAYFSAFQAIDTLLSALEEQTGFNLCSDIPRTMSAIIDDIGEGRRTPSLLLSSSRGQQRPRDGFQQKNIKSRFALVLRSLVEAGHSEDAAAAKHWEKVRAKLAKNGVDLDSDFGRARYPKASTSTIKVWALDDVFRASYAKHLEARPSWVKDWAAASDHELAEAIELWLSPQHTTLRLRDSRRATA